MKEEARNLKRLKDKGFAVPLVFRVDKEASKLYMEWIEGPTIKDILCGPSLSLVNGTKYLLIMTCLDAER